MNTVTNLDAYEIQALSNEEIEQINGGIATEIVVALIGAIAGVAIALINKPSNSGNSATGGAVAGGGSSQSALTYHVK